MHATPRHAELTVESLHVKRFFPTGKFWVVDILLLPAFAPTINAFPNDLSRTVGDPTGLSITLI